MAALWKLDAVSLSGRQRPRLDRLTCEIPNGTTAVMGPSGAGKTSLLNVLVGFERPDGGRIERTEAATDEAGCSRLPVYWSPPDDGLWSHLTVRRHLEVVAAQPMAVGGLLEEFDLAALAERSPAGLSEGERSRLSAARALASGAAVLVLDEPLVHVDAPRAAACWDALRRRCRAQGTSLVFASHDAVTVMREAGQVLCLDQGRLLWQGAVAELYDRPATPELARFLGPVNWFEGEDGGRWLNGAAPVPLSLRPEALDIVPADDSPLVVAEARSCGGFGETRVQDERSGATRPFYHRSRAAALRAGTRVALRVLCGLCLAAGLAGCSGSAEGKTIPIGSQRIWALPVVGSALPAPRSLTYSPQGELYVLDDAGRVVVYDALGKLARSWEMPEHEVGNPEGVVVLHDGRIAVADTHYHRVVLFAATGEVSLMFGREGEGPGEFIYPADITQDPDGFLYVTEYGGNSRVQKFTPEGTFVLECGEPGTDAGQFQRTAGILWHEHQLYVADAINNRVQVFADDGRFVGVLADAAGAGLEYPYELGLAADGTLYVVEYQAGRVTQMSLTGEVLGRYGATGRGTGEFWTPWGLAVAPDGRIAVADTGNRRIVELSP